MATGPEDSAPTPPPSTPRTKSKFPDAIAALRTLPRWITWRTIDNPGGRPTKRPDASTLRPAEWTTLDNLEPAERSANAGVGFVFTSTVTLQIDGAPAHVLALDLDACVHDDGTLSPWADELLANYPGTFVEFSPSRRGLHVLLATRTLPAPVSRIRVPADAPPGVDKKPEIQLFGTGPAGYVTVTDNVYPGAAPALVVFPDLSWLEQRYLVGAFGAPGTTELPTGEGDAPTFDAIDDVLRASPMTSALLDGDWASLNLPSASEGWWRLSRAALRAARNHGATAARYLITRSAYGRGEIDSRDPARYARLEWVERDLARVASKTDDSATRAAFNDDFDPETWRPPTAPLPSSGDPWVLPFETLLRRRTQRRWLYKNLFPARGIAQFYGDPSCGKTPAAVSLAIHVARGLPWFGYQLKRPGSVVYMIGEDESGIIDRFEAQLQLSDGLCTLAELPVYATTRPGELIDPNNRKRWVNEIRGALQRKPGPPLSLLIVDTQSRNFGPGNENDTEDMAKFVQQVDALSRQLDVLVLLVHHKGVIAKDRARGSGVLFAAADACFEITREGRTIVLESKKAKNWADPLPFSGYLEPVRIGTDEDGDPITAITLAAKEPSLAEQFPLEQTVRETDEAELIAFLRALNDVGPVPLTARTFQQRVRVTWRTATRFLAVAQRERCIEVRPAVRRKDGITYQLTDAGKRRAGIVPPDSDSAAALQGIEPPPPPAGAGGL